ncbi:MAG: hypothetical protein ACFFCS_17140 [Candidatus Hodarchaeota archaeon]
MAGSMDVFTGECTIQGIPNVQHVVELEQVFINLGHLEDWLGTFNLGIYHRASAFIEGHLTYDVFNNNPTYQDQMIIIEFNPVTGEMDVFWERVPDSVLSHLTDYTELWKVVSISVQLGEFMNDIYTLQYDINRISLPELVFIVNDDGVVEFTFHIEYSSGEEPAMFDPFIIVVYGQFNTITNPVDYATAVNDIDILDNTLTAYVVDSILIFGSDNFLGVLDKLDASDHILLYEVPVLLDGDPTRLQMVFLNLQTENTISTTWDFLNEQFTLNLHGYDGLAEVNAQNILEISHLSLIEEDLNHLEIILTSAHLAEGSLDLELVVGETQVYCEIDLHGGIGPLTNVVDDNGVPIGTGTFNDLQALYDFITA